MPRHFRLCLGDIVEDAEIRSAREQTTGELYYSMVDIIFALREDYSHSESANYWSVMKHRLLKKRYIYDRINCHKVMVEAKDGKRRGTDFMNLDDAFFVLRKLSVTIKSTWRNSLKSVQIQSVQKITTRIKDCRKKRGARMNTSFLCVVSRFRKCYFKIPQMGASASSARRFASSYSMETFSMSP